MLRIFATVAGDDKGSFMHVASFLSSLFTSGFYVVCFLSFHQLLLQQSKHISLFACWFQSGLISQPTVFSSHNKSALAGLISP